MSELLSEFEIVKSKIAKMEAKLEKAEQDGKADLVLMYGNLLHTLYQEKQRLENSGIVINFSMFLLFKFVVYNYLCFRFIANGWTLCDWAISLQLTLTAGNIYFSNNIP
jgi:hypothetical protein